MKISELRLLQLAVEFRATQFFQEFWVGPQPSRRCAFRITQGDLIFLLFSWIVLVARIHRFAVGFVIPPGVAEVSRLHIRAGMNMANHALARGDGAGEAVLYGMAGFIFCNRGIGRRAFAEVAERRVGP